MPGSVGVISPCGLDGGGASVPVQSRPGPRAGSAQSSGPVQPGSDRLGSVQTRCDTRDARAAEMSAEGSGTIRSRIKSLLRSPSFTLRRRSGGAATRHKDTLTDKVSTTHARAHRYTYSTYIHRHTHRLAYTRTRARTRSSVSEGSGDK